ncbi:MAG: ROK family glucokinase [Actinobacteria bacterium]|uniref:Glucokinase n=1 Tax=freshwater metagenome TaxID=449393 RepID=A0A6J7FIX1_9ZZZZ|nr:ROK family glucokinase [Actinomycetota bacterium]
MLTIGVDIGGTKIAAALVDPEGTIHAQTTRPTPATDVSAIEDSVVAVVEELAEGNAVLAVGVAAAGFIDASQSVVYYSPNLAWRNEPLRERIEARIGLPTVIENDANAAGWAEYRFGAGRPYTHMTMLTIGTGVGGAIIIDNRLFRGGFGVGAELGHLRVVPDGILCGCGARGCIEQYGSGRSLLRYAAEVSHDPVIGAALAAVRQSDGSINSADMRNLLADGDAGAREALATLGRWLGRACASLDAVLDPQVFVIGGGVSVAGEYLLGPIRESFHEHVSAQGFTPEPEFRIAEMTNDAGAIGAADLARRHAYRDD